MRICVDALGGEHGTQEVLAGALSAVAKNKDLELTLVGDDSLRGVRHPRIRTCCDTRAIRAEDSLRSVLKGDCHSSMRVALERLAAGEVDGVVSCGSSAALVALAKHLIPMLPGMSRPALVKHFGGIAGNFWLLDIGANIECSARQLEQFAVMGAMLASTLGGRKGPRVALLNIGEEAVKGNAVIREAAQRIGALENLEYVGFVEPHRLFDGKADVVVADGMLGNVACKSIEGTARMLRRVLGENLAQTEGLSESLKRLESLLDPEGYNGACLAGLEQVVVKSHGFAKQRGIACAIAECEAAIREGVCDCLRESLQGYSECR